MNNQDLKRILIFSIIIIFIYGLLYILDIPVNCYISNIISLLYLSFISSIVIKTITNKNKNKIKGMAENKKTFNIKEILKDKFANTYQLNPYLDNNINEIIYDNYIPLYANVDIDFIKDIENLKKELTTNIEVNNSYIKALTDETLKGNEIKILEDKNKKNKDYLYKLDMIVSILKIDNNLLLQINNKLRWQLLSIKYSLLRYSISIIDDKVDDKHLVLYQYVNKLKNNIKGLMINDNDLLTNIQIINNEIQQRFK